MPELNREQEVTLEELAVEVGALRVSAIPPDVILAEGGRWEAEAFLVERAWVIREDGTYEPVERSLLLEFQGVVRDLMGDPGAVVAREGLPPSELQDCAEGVRATGLDEQAALLMGLVTGMRFERRIRESAERASEAR